MLLTDSAHNLWFTETPAYKMSEAESLDEVIDEIIEKERVLEDD